MWLTRLALRNPVLILMVALMTVVIGYVSLKRLSVDLFPDFTIPVIRVGTFYTGAGPADIEKTITQPIERAVAAVPGVDRVESTSKQGFSVVNVWFNYGVNLDNAQFEVAQRVGQVMNALPPGIQQPFIIKFDITNMPVVQLAVTSDELDDKQLYDLAYNVIEPQIERIDGIASATVMGGRVREMTVQVDRDALRARGLGILDVVNAVRNNNLLLPSGNLRSGDRDYNVFANTQVELARHLDEVIVAPGSGGIGPVATAPVRLADVATTVDGAADQTEILRINGRPGVGMRVLKQPGANTIAVVANVRKAITQLRGVPANVKVEVGFDASAYISASVKSLEHEALWGGLLAVLVILVFLISLRATGIIAVAIPLSIVATFALLYFSGQTLNIFTLGGLALGVGRLVDDSIVELENIHRHLATGQSRREAVLAAAQEVAMPILVSTITTIVVFFPVLFLAGVARMLFLPLALTISFALVMSFFVSRTVTPLLCYYTLRSGVHGPTQRRFAFILRFLDWLDAAYARALGVVLRHRALTVTLILGVFAASLLLSSRIGTEFFPDSDESQFSVVYKTPIGTRVEKTVQVAARLEQAAQKALGAAPGRPALYDLLFSDSGLPLTRAAMFTPNSGPHAGWLAVNLLPRSRRPISDVEASERVRREVRDAFPGTQLYFSTGGIVKRMLNMGAPAPIDVEILGYDLEEGAAYAKKVHAALQNLHDTDGRPLLTDVQISREENYPQFDVVVDRQKAGVLGLNEQQVAQSVLASLVGSTQFSPVRFTDPKTGNEYYINVRLHDRHRSRVSDLGDVFMRGPTGAMVSLDTVARVERGSGPVQIQRKYLQRIIDVTANVAPGKDLGKASAAAQRALDDLPPPEGFNARLGGQTEAQKSAFADLGFAALMALMLVYMVLASQFKSLIDPLVIMFSVPLGITGVFVMLWATRTTLSINSFMGVIMMVGIVVSNGVLLVDFANQLRERGLPLVEATIKAGRTRLRPILMTTIATIFGLMPMAIGLGEGSETNLPLARAVIGGLSVSTLFTLFLVPALYTWLGKYTRHRTPDDDAAPAAPAAAATDTHPAAGGVGA
ncbi:MAG: efflux RND transporter permease subunit [Gemmatimonadales bacterium]|jgi:hydrophobe/amphiphile efflux-1 (HAE1) family protein|nr:efflux RND transporter permease subunit [Gemmatimonadales bacterium]